MVADRLDKTIYQDILNLKEKLEQTFRECKSVVEKRTPYCIRQKEFLVQPYTEG